VTIDEDGAWEKYEEMKRKGVIGINLGIQLISEIQPPISKVRISYVQPSTLTSEDVTVQTKKGSPIDPFDSKVLHKSVYRYIAQHLTGMDLLAVSEVSTTWNEVAESNNIGDKVRLKFNADALSVEDFKIMTSSSRKYTDVSMKAESEASSGVLWIFADSVEKLTVDITENREFKASINFPNLISLDLTAADIYFDEVGSEDSWILRSSMGQLEDLKLTVKASENNDVIFHTFLAKQSELEILDLCDCHHDFLDDFDKTPLFQLDVLRFSSFPRELMESQRESLQILDDFGPCFKNDFASYLSDFPNLTALEVSLCDEADWQLDAEEDEDLPVNMNIKSLNLHSFSNHENRYEPFDLASQDILVALPELESLYIQNLTGHMMEFIAFNLRKLEEFRCWNAEEGAWERYEEMKRTGVEGINSKI
jgi:hypothetical protein